MNKDSREEGVTSKALKVVGGATVIGGTGYGVHRGMNSQKATDYLAKDFGEKGPGMMAKGVSKYRERVNPFVDTTKGAIKDMFARTPKESEISNPNDIVLKNKEVVKNPDKRKNTKVDPINSVDGKGGDIILNTAGDTANGGNINAPEKTPKGKGPNPNKEIAINSQGDSILSQKLDTKINAMESKNIVTDTIGNTNGGKNINVPDVKPNILGADGVPIKGGKVPKILGADGNPIKGGKASKILTGQADNAAKKIILNSSDDVAAGASKIITKILS